MLGCALVALLSASSLGADLPQQRRFPPAAAVPGEFEPVEEVVVAWEPELAQYQLEVIAQASGFSPVRVLIDPGVPSAELIEGIARHATPYPVTLETTPVDSVWLRDYGPVILRAPDGARTFVDFTYFGEQVDDDIPAALAAHYGARLQPVNLEFEGGNFLSDGRGTCIVTELLFEINSHMSRARVRSLFRRHLGCRRLISLPYLDREETRHVDMFASITAEGRALVGDYLGGDDPTNARILDRIAARLRREGFEVQRVPMPDNHDGLFRTYLNFTPVNGAVLVPVYDFDTRYEQQALQTIGRAYPGRVVIPVVADQIIELQGSIRCSTGIIPRS